MDRSIEALMNCSNNILNVEFQGNFNLSLQDSKGFNLQKEFNFDNSSKKVIYSQDSGIQVSEFKIENADEKSVPTDFFAKNRNSIKVFERDKKVEPSNTLSVMENTEVIHIINMDSTRDDKRLSLIKSNRDDGCASTKGSSAAVILSNPLLVINDLVINYRKPFVIKVVLHRTRYCAFRVGSDKNTLCFLSKRVSTPHV